MTEGTTLQQFELRPPAPAERETLLDLWVESWRATFPDIDFVAREKWFVSHLAKIEGAGAKLICAFDGAQMMGFVTIDAREQWLDQLCLHPQAFGSGAARALLEAAREISPQRIGLDVNADNFRALRFYEREGFVNIRDGLNTLSGRKTVVLEWKA